MSGKGSNRRPQGVDEDTMASNWDRVFGGEDNGAKPNGSSEVMDDDGKSSKKKP